MGSDRESDSLPESSREAGDQQADWCAHNAFSPVGYLRDRAFWGLTVTQFLGAFNDNLFKQTVLLLFVAVPAANGEVKDLQGLATLVFSLPFILFSGFAGFLSDRYGKSSVIFLAKVAEIAIMALGMLAFFWYSQAGLASGLIAFICFILFAMGAQSAFFGPGKYGILPELFRKRDLPGANGLVLMTTFLAIIFGSALAGELKLQFGDRLYLVGAACVGIAFVGTIASLTLRRPTPAQPGLKPTVDALLVPSAIRNYLWRDREMLAAVGVSCIFWLSAAMVQLIVNSLGKNQLGLNDRDTSLMVAMISAGIAVGSVVAGVWSGNRFRPRIMRTGAAGVVVCLLLLAAPANNDTRHLLGFVGSSVVLAALGGFTGLFAVPLQVFVQSRPPTELKGRMIATLNLVNWIGIVFSAGVYQLAESLTNTLNWPKCVMFFVAAAFLTSVVCFYHPREVVFADTNEP